MPKVSIVLPVYNEQKYLELAIRSIAEQSYKDYEFLITQNGSTDQSPEIIARWAKQDPRIKVEIVEVNRGYLDALNGGLNKAQGQYIARMDGDDIALPDRLKKQVEFLDQNPDHVLVGTNVANIDEEGDVYCDQPFPSSNDELVESLLSGNCGICHPTTMFRRSAIEQTGVYLQDMRGVEDQDLWLRLAEIGKLANLPEVLLQYRVHSGNISFEQETHAHQVLRSMLRKAHERRGLPLSEPANPPTDKTTEFDRKLHWAWSAVHSGNHRTARKHACRLLSSKPFSRSAWVLMTYALLGNRAERIRKILGRS